jgi:YfiR/HmsC-like
MSLNVMECVPMPAEYRLRLSSENTWAAWAMKFSSKFRLVIALSAGAIAPHLAGASLPTEADLKAVFLFHFTQFVEWPVGVFPSPDAPFVIGILGRDPFGDALENIVRGEKVGQHPLVVRTVSGYSSERTCQILYVPRDTESLLDTARLTTAPVLTVGESTEFYDAGGIVQFVTERRHVRLRVNLTAARSHSLIISAKLLRVAEVSEIGPTLMKFWEGEEAARLEIPVKLSGVKVSKRLPAGPMQTARNATPKSDVFASNLMARTVSP